MTVDRWRERVAAGQVRGSEDDLDARVRDPCRGLTVPTPHREIVRDPEDGLVLLRDRVGPELVASDLHETVGRATERRARRVAGVEEALRRARADDDDLAVIDRAANERVRPELSAKARLGRESDLEVARYDPAIVIVERQRPISSVGGRDVRQEYDIRVNEPDISRATTREERIQELLEPSTDRVGPGAGGARV